MQGKGTQALSGGTQNCIQKQGPKTYFATCQGIRELEGGIYELFMSEIMESGDRVRFIRKVL